MNALDVKVSNLLRDNFQALKCRDRASFDSLLDICKRYEDLRLATSYVDVDKYNEINVKTGRALSNICFDIMRLNGEISLDQMVFGKREGAVELFFMAHRGGLCNRLRAISSLRLLARKIDVSFSFSWSEIELCNGGPLPTSNLVSRLDSLIYRLKNELSVVFLADEPMTPWYYFSILGSHCGYKSWSEFLEDYRVESQNLLDEMIHSSADSKKIKESLSEITCRPYVSLHIRRTDFLDYFKEKFPDERLPQIDDYISWIKNNYPEGRIYVSADDVEVKNLVKENFPGRVINENQYHDKSKVRQTGFVEALIDLAALSRGKVILPTPRSSFSEYACSISSGEIVKLWGK